MGAPVPVLPSQPQQIQRRLMRYYGLESLPCVSAFVTRRDDIERERLLVRCVDGVVEVALELPAGTDRPTADLSLDQLCQIVEGVSHFVLIAERARRELPTTQLELELQAEVDKYVLLAVAHDHPVSAAHATEVRASLFDRAVFCDPPETEKGERYRLAHRLALGFVCQLEAMYLRDNRRDELRRVLRRFFSAGQSEKLALARVA